MRRITFLLIIFLIVGCESGENPIEGTTKNPVKNLALSSGILLREGDQEIYVGSGTAPRISWTGGNIGNLGVQYWNDIEKQWECRWSIWTGGEGDLILSPVTYGVLPSKAQDYWCVIIDKNTAVTTSSDGCKIRTERELEEWRKELVLGEHYKIIIASNSHIKYSQIKSQISVLHFIR